VTPTTSDGGIDPAGTCAEIRHQFGPKCPAPGPAYTALHYKQSVGNAAEFRSGEAGNAPGSNAGGDLIATVTENLSV